MREQIFEYKDLVEMFGAHTRFGEIVENIEAELWKRGEVICEIYINSKCITQEDEERRKNDSVKEIKRLKVISFKHSELLKNSRDTIVELIPKMKTSAQTVADELRNKGEYSNFDFLVHLIDQCHWISESLYLLRPQLKRVEPNESFTQKWREAEKKLSVLAGHTLSSFQKRDYLLVSDLLQYELPNNLDLWDELLQSPEVMQSLQNL